MVEFAHAEGQILLRFRLDPIPEAFPFFQVQAFHLEKETVIRSEPAEQTRSRYKSFFRLKFFYENLFPRECLRKYSFHTLFPALIPGVFE